MLTFDYVDTNTLPEGAAPPGEEELINMLQQEVGGRGVEEKGGEVRWGWGKGV
jgi:hypothetical protein